MTDQDLSFSTPMMQQYLEIKKRYQDCILFFRLGDFFELFLEDAEIGARILDITLTSRARGKDGRIPMAGVPFHAVDSYIAKLIRAGYKVALCDQVTAPNGKNLVERDVVRIITPGTVLDNTVLDAKNNNYLMAAVVENQQLGLAIIDITTGDCLANQFDLSLSPLDQVLHQACSFFEPSELIFNSKTSQLASFHQWVDTHSPIAAHEVHEWESWVSSPLDTITASFPGIKIQSSSLAEQPLAQQVVAALVQYVQYTQKTEIKHFRSIEPLLSGLFLSMDRSTITNLELTHTLRENQKQGSFLKTIDFTYSAMGGRLLKRWLLQPLQEVEAITQRQDAIEYLHEQPNTRLQLQHALKHIQDIERLLARLSLRAGTPRDLKALENSLQLIMELPQSFSGAVTPLLTAQLSLLKHSTLKKIRTLIANTIVDDPPVDTKAGGLVKRGVDPELDRLRDIVSNSKQWIAQLEATERQRTGISSLKIKFNQVFGFYIEVSKANLHLVPESYTRKQTLVNAERFMTPELKEHEEIILTAEEKMNHIEYLLFLDTVERVLSQLPQLQHAAQAVAVLDCLQGLAELAEVKRFTRPSINQTGLIEIKGGRHLVVEELVSSHRYVPNNVTLNAEEHQLVLITGPNMAGKSVVMRQVALITILAHMGSFVPAASASINLTDQIFVRSGAADMISAGLSTFMVEMTETAYILKHATDRSLVIMDEIGRGTSTYDGISIAWAIAAFLVTDPTIRPKTLFATHYHELQSLATTYPKHISNYHMAITEHQGKPVFLYTFKPGAASHSYGVAVAELAGVPEPVVNQAQRILAELEQSHQPATAPGTEVQPPVNSVQTVDSPPQQLLAEITNFDLNSVTPLEAFSQLMAWQKKYKSSLKAERRNKVS
jgi:DNA mismatch repair protein MutS